MDVMLSRILLLIGSKHGAAQELVRAIGCPKNAVTDWKAGRSRSYKEYAPQIADYYGVSLDWLSGLSDDKGIKKSASSEDKADDETIARINAELEDMSKDDLLKVLAMIEVIKK
jgi:transcriptional regulator with XRE-family HTH domain